MKHWRKHLLGCVLLVSLWGFCSACLPLVLISGAGSVQISLRRDFGVALGDGMQGQFTLTGTGTDDIVEMRLFFNAQLVHEASGSSLSFPFSTDDYPHGSTNITLIGLNNDGTQVQSTIVKDFLDPFINVYIIIGIAIVVVVSLYFKYGRRRRSNNTPGEST